MSKKKKRLIKSKAIDIADNRLANAQKVEPELETMNGILEIGDDVSLADLDPTSYLSLELASPQLILLSPYFSSSRCLMFDQIKFVKALETLRRKNSEKEQAKAKYSQGDSDFGVDLHLDSMEWKKEVRSMLVVREIVASEKSYMGHLTNLLEVSP